LHMLLYLPMSALLSGLHPDRSPGGSRARAQRPTSFCRCSGYRAPCTLISEAALSSSRRSAGVSWSDAAAMFSRRRWSFVVPGIGTIQDF